MNDISTISITAGNARAELCPELGANCVSLYTDDANILRTPPDGSTYREQPNVYGEPLLFPPNRLNGGAYTYHGTRYTFPINEPARGHHIHGFLSGTAFELVRIENDTKAAEASFRYCATAEKPYLQFPHSFTVERTYRLTGTSLRNTVRITNDGDKPMPVGIGFHTTFNVCFLADSDPAHYRVNVPVGEEIMLNRQTIIPTGERVKDNELIQALNHEGILPLERPISNHFTRALGEAEITHWPTGRRIRYRVSETLAYWMLWNAKGEKRFFCIEPQTWMVDAPNQSYDTAVSGFRALDPGASMTLWTEIVFAQ